MVKIQYFYEVIKSESLDYQLGDKIWTMTKLHDNRKKDKIAELSDKKCKDFTLKLIKQRGGLN